MNSLDCDSLIHTQLVIQSLFMNHLHILNLQVIFKNNEQYFFFKFGILFSGIKK